MRARGGRARATRRHVTVALSSSPPRRLLAGFATPWRIAAHTARKRLRVDAAALRGGHCDGFAVAGLGGAAAGA